MTLAYLVNLLLSQGSSKEGDKRIRIRARLEDALLLAFNMEGGTLSQGMRAASRSWKNKKTGAHLGPPEGARSCSLEVRTSDLQDCNIIFGLAKKFVRVFSIT